MLHTGKNAISQKKGMPIKLQLHKMPQKNYNQKTEIFGFPVFITSETVSFTQLTLRSFESIGCKVLMFVCVCVQAIITSKLF